MLENQPVIVDLGMSDSEYLQQLAQGNDPVKAYCNQAYHSVLMHYGLSAATASHIAPLLDKLDCSIEEKLLVNQTLRHIWHQLTKQPDRQERL